VQPKQTKIKIPVKGVDEKKQKQTKKNKNKLPIREEFML